MMKVVTLRYYPNLQQSRWTLLCVLCKERVGACIQCSVKTCKTAYHVTCAFKKGLEMRAIIEDENAEDGVKLRVSVAGVTPLLQSYTYIIAQKYLAYGEAFTVST